MLDVRGASLDLVRKTKRLYGEKIFYSYEDTSAEGSHTRGAKNSVKVKAEVGTYRRKLDFVRRFHLFVWVSLGFPLSGNVHE